MKKAVIFDLDGTLYCGESAVSGAIKTINALEGLDYWVFYLTNNSGKSREWIVEKLNKLGFYAELQNIYCGSYALGNYLREKELSPVYLIGTHGLRSDLLSLSIKVGDYPSAAAVVIGLDPFFNYGKIALALDAIRNGAKLIVANLDPSYPVENNRRLPGCGAMVGAIVGATGHQPDFIVGKPNTYMLELLCAEHELLPEEICLVGDEPRSDIAMAVNFQCQGVLFDPEDAFPEFPGYKIRNLREIILLIKKGR